MKGNPMPEKPKVSREQRFWYMLLSVLLVLVLFKDRAPWLTAQQGAFVVRTENAGGTMVDRLYVDTGQDVETLEVRNAELSMNGQRIVNVGDPVLGKDAVNKDWVVANINVASTGFPSTEIFNGVFSGARTDLDLSGVVGATERVAILRVTNGSPVDHSFSFRKRGETVFGSLGTRNSANGIMLLANATGYALVVTDANGIVEWSANSQVNTARVVVMAYW